MELFFGIPSEFYMIYNELQKLRFEDEPEYDKYVLILKITSPSLCDFRFPENHIPV